MLSRKEILNLIKKNRDTISRFQVKRLGLFGSFLYQSANPNSDIDLIVEFEKGEKTFDNYMDLKFFLEELFDRKVDLVLPNTIKQSLKSKIMENVMYAEGI